MRTLRSALCIMFLTAIGLIYVHQQVELVKLSYSIGIKERCLKEMLDHRESLSYNIDNLEAPLRLEQVLSSQKIDLAFPRSAHVVDMMRSGYFAHGKHARPVGVEGKLNPIAGLLDFFTPRAEAQASER